METIDSTLQPADYVLKFISQTNKNIFLTGKAGTGKTTLLHSIVENTFKKCVVAAPTGIAAINAKGVTLHSLFQLPFGHFIPEKQNTENFNQHTKLNNPFTIIRDLQMFDAKRKLLREIELLIIDEVSMLRADLLDAIDVVLRHVRRKHSVPFGGLQILFIGDMLQLPPVVKDFEWDQLKHFYKSIYFFDAKVLQNNSPVYVELDKIYRQADETFINLLNHLRDNELNREDIDLLNKYYKPHFQSTTHDNYVTLTTHNHKANTLNKNFLDRLEQKSFVFNATVEGDFNESAYPLEKDLELKKGAQIMFVKNDPTGQQRFYNGKLAVINKIDSESIEVKFNDSEDTLIVEEYTWENIKYRVDSQSNEIEENIAGKFIQYPIRLAWAITVHKSQGLTFEKAIIDIGEAFAPGQVYVALSRLRSLEGLVLTSQINISNITNDEKIATYSKTQTSQQNLKELLSDETVEYLKNYLLKSFDFSDVLKAFQNHTDSFLNDEKKSVKQSYQHFAKDLEKRINDLMPVSIKFKNQISNTFDNKLSGFLEFIYSRVISASGYFLPILKEIGNEIFYQSNKLKLEKKTKSYLSELIELEVLLFEQQKQIKKSAVILEITCFQKSFSKLELNSLLRDTERDDKLKNLQMPIITGEGGTKVKNKRIRKPREKKEKIDTKEATFKLYKSGKNITEIAIARNLAYVTIESHLVYFVTKGEFKAEEFVATEKKEKIISMAKELETLYASPIKEALGDGFSFSEIKFAIAGYLFETREN